MTDFDEAAAAWDTPEREERARALAAAIREHAPPDPGSRLIEIGAGTGLLGLQFAREVESVMLTDPSVGMLEVARRKIEAAGLGNVSTAVWDAPGNPPPGSPYGLAISLLALHHVEDTGQTFRSIHGLLGPDGHIALLDLDAEDGSFHDDDIEGIHPQGFDRREIERLAKSLGFTDVATRLVYEIEREGRAYPLFLLTGRRS